MQRRRSRSVAVLLAAALLVAACSDDDDGGGDATSTSAAQDVTRIAVLLEPGTGDDPATTTALEQAESDLDVEVEVLEPSPDGSDRGELLELLAADDADLVIAVGADAQAPLEEVAADHPDVRFAAIGGTEPAEPNVTAVQVRTEQAAYLAGAVAALSSPTKHLGFVGGADDAPTRALQAGFTAGAVRIDEATQVDVAILPADGPGDATAAATAAAAQYDAGAEVVLGTPAGVDEGVFAAAAEQDPPARAVGVGPDRSDDLDPALAPVVLTWAVLHADAAVLDVIEAFVEDRLDPGVRTLGLEEGAVGITTDGLPVDVVTQVEDLTERLLAGEIQVPTTP